MRPLLGGGHGTIVGHVIHETGVGVILARRHAECLSALRMHKRSGFIRKSICDVCGKGGNVSLNNIVVVNL